MYPTDAEVRYFVLVWLRFISLLAAIFQVRSVTELASRVVGFFKYSTQPLAHHIAGLSLAH